MNNSDQETSGFLPPTNAGFTDELRRQPSSYTTTLTGNSPHHLPRFTELYISPSQSHTTIPDSHLLAAHGRAIFTIPSTSIHDAVPATATAAVNTHNPISPTVSGVTTSSDQEHTTTTSTPPKTGEPPRKNPLRRTLSDIISSVRKATPSPNSRTTGPWSSNEKESPQSKRLRKTKETVTEIQQKCWEVRDESRVKEADVGVDNPSEAIVKQEEDEDEVRGEFVRFKRLDDGGLNIKLSCSCGKCFEFLHNRRKCYYKIDIAAVHPSNK